MKVVIDASAVRDGSGGMATYLRGLLEGWREAAAGDELTVLGTRDLPHGLDPLVEGGVLRSGSTGQFGRVRLQQLHLPRLAAERGADAILSTDPSIPLFPRGCPVVATVHDLRHLRQPGEFSRARRLYRGLLWGYGLRRADSLITNSHATEAHVRQVCPSAVSRVHTVHFGCDHVLRWGTSDRTMQQAVTFAHWANKRPELAIETWAALAARRPDFAHVLHVVGAPSELRPRLEALAEARGLGARVQVHGFLDDDRYRALFVASALVLMPSTLEGFGFPVLEAMRLGIPVVVSPGVGMEEAGGEWAYYARDATPEAFADGCERALFDATERARMVQGGLAHAERFTWRRTAGQVREVVAAATRR